MSTSSVPDSAVWIARKHIRLRPAQLLAEDPRFYKKLARLANHRVDVERVLVKLLLAESGFVPSDPCLKLPQAWNWNAAAAEEFAAVVHARVCGALKVVFLDRIEPGKSLRAEIAPDRSALAETYNAYLGLFRLVAYFQEMAAEERSLAAEMDQSCKALSQLEGEKAELERQAVEKRGQIETKREEARKHWEQKVETLGEQLFSIQTMHTVCTSAAIEMRRKLDSQTARLSQLKEEEARVSGGLIASLLEDCANLGMGPVRNELETMPCLRGTADLPESVRARLDQEFERQTCFRLDYLIERKPPSPLHWKAAAAVSGTACAGALVWLVWPEKVERAPDAPLPLSEPRIKQPSDGLPPGYTEMVTGPYGFGIYRGKGGELVTIDWGAMRTSAGDSSPYTLEGRYQATSPGAAWEPLTWKNQTGARAVSPVFPKEAVPGPHLLQLTCIDAAGNASQTYYRLDVRRFKTKSYFAVGTLPKEQVRNWMRGLAPMPWEKARIVPRSTSSFMLDKPPHIGGLEIQFKPMHMDGGAWKKAGLQIYQGYLEGEKIAGSGGASRNWAEIDPVFPKDTPPGFYRVRAVQRFDSGATTFKIFRYTIGPDLIPAFLEHMEE